MGRGRLFIIIAIIIVIGGVAIAFLAFPSNPAPSDPDPLGGTTGGTGGGGGSDIPTATPMQFVEIVIAVQPLPRGIRIPPNGVQLRRWPAEVAPFNSFSSLEDVVGKVARTDISREQPILQDMVTEDLTGLADVGSDLAAILPPGQVAIALPMDRLTSVAYAIQPGDRVDVIMSMLFVDVDDGFQTIVPNCFDLIVLVGTDVQSQRGEGRICGRVDLEAQLGPVIISPSEVQRPRLVTQRTVQDARVMYLGDFPPDGRFLGVAPTPTPAPAEEGEAAAAEEGGDTGGRRQATPAPTANTRPTIITLAVTPQDAVVLTWAVEARLPVTFVLRSATDTASYTTTSVTLDYLMSRYDITLPVKRGYTIEPAIRSIRQLFVGEEISLQPTPDPATEQQQGN
jgi:Flp pilus assembly protein CpaB